MLLRTTLFLACISLALQTGQMIAPRLRTNQPCRPPITREAPQNGRFI